MYSRPNQFTSLMWLYARIFFFNLSPYLPYKIGKKSTTSKTTKQHAKNVCITTNSNCVININIKQNMSTLTECWKKNSNSWWILPAYIYNSMCITTFITISSYEFSHLYLLKMLSYIKRCHWLAIYCPSIKFIHFKRKQVTPRTRQIFKSLNAGAGSS